MDARDARFPAPPCAPPPPRSPGAEPSWPQVVRILHMLCAICRGIRARMRAMRRAGAGGRGLRGRGPPGETWPAPVRDRRLARPGTEKARIVQIFLATAPGRSENCINRPRRDPLRALRLGEDVQQIRTSNKTKILRLPAMTTSHALPHPPANDPPRSFEGRRAGALPILRAGAGCHPGTTSPGRRGRRA